MYYLYIMDSFFAMLGLVGVVYMIYRMFLKAKKTHADKIEIFKQFAQKYNLNHSESNYLQVRMSHMSGEIEGLKIQIFEEMESSGKNRQIITTFRILFDEKQTEFNLFKKTKAGKLGKRLGVKYVELNNPEFDKNYMLRSEDENVHEIFKAENQRLLIENRQHYFGESAAKSKIFAYVFRGALLKQEHMDQFEKMIEVFIQMYKK